jgi:hypothetical protein
MRCDEESRAGGKICSADVIRDCKIRTINDELASRTKEHRSRRRDRSSRLKTRKCSGRKTEGTRNLGTGSCTERMVVVIGGNTA